MVRYKITEEGIKRLSFRKVWRVPTEQIRVLLRLRESLKRSSVGITRVTLIRHLGLVEDRRGQKELADDLRQMLRKKYITRVYS